MATAINTIQSQSLPTVGLKKPGRCYTLCVDDHEVLVDPTDKGKPGDIVVLWPKKKAPVVCRRLARVAPFPGDADRPSPLADRYYFADPETDVMFDVPLNKTAAIHKVVDVPSEGVYREAAQ